ncbi:unnamed protein product [Effrenium voratum]|nr:unnamed protein product [Effrenium voratum]
MRILRFLSLALCAAVRESDVSGESRHHSEISLDKDGEKEHDADAGHRAQQQAEISAALRSIAESHECSVEDNAQVQSLLQSLRQCLEARKKLSAETQSLLKQEKEGGKIYATEVSGIMDLIKKVQDSGRMELPWKQDHVDALAQLLEKTDEAENAAEVIWTDKKSNETNKSASK